MRSLVILFGVFLIFSQLHWTQKYESVGIFVKGDCLSIAQSGEQKDGYCYYPSANVDGSIIRQQKDVNINGVEFSVARDEISGYALSHENSQVSFTWRTWGLFLVLAVIAIYELYTAACLVQRLFGKPPG